MSKPTLTELYKQQEPYYLRLDAIDKELEVAGLSSEEFTRLDNERGDTWGKVMEIHSEIVSLAKVR